MLLSVRARMESSSPSGVHSVEFATRPLLNFILILAPLGTLLAPLTIALFVFSPSHSRRHPVFILNVLACCLGIAEAVVAIALDTTQILLPYRPLPKGLLTTVVVLTSVSPLLADSILLFRIAAFFLFGTTQMTTLLAIFGYPLLVKCGRFTVIVMFLNSFTRGIIHSTNIFLEPRPNWHKNPLLLAGWILQTVDNAYASSIFLYKLWEFYKSTKGVAALRNRYLVSSLQCLFVIALGNFIFPVLMNIALIILITMDPSIVISSFILVSNNYVSIIGVVFATVWGRKRGWNQQEEPFKGEPLQHRRAQNESRFAIDSSLNTGFSIPVFHPAPAIRVQETSTSDQL